MPYDNPLNRKIAEELKKINERYIEHTLNSYDLDVAESNIGFANKKLIDDSNINQERNDLKYKENNLMSGGAYGSKGGFARGTWRDTGYDSTLGAGKKYKKNYKNSDEDSDEENKSIEGGYSIPAFTKALKRRSKISNPLDIENSITGALKDLNIPIVSNVAGYVNTAGTALKSLMPDKSNEGGKKRKPRKKKETKMSKKKLKEEKKEPKEEKENHKKEEKENHKKEVKYEKELLLKRTMEGGAPSKEHIGEMKKKKGRPSKMKGGSSDLAQPHNMVNNVGITGNGKNKKNDRIIGGNLVPVAQMLSSGMSGQGKNKYENMPRSDIVKDIMKERNVSMIKASSIVKSEGLYIPKKK